jgi:hypothetical protein
VDITSKSMGPLSDALLVVIDGSQGDLPLLRWAAEEASETDRPLVVAHAAGHLPPHLTFAERRVAGQQRREAARSLLDHRVAVVRQLAPGIEVESTVRLLDAAMLLKAAGAEAHTMAMTAEVWKRQEKVGPRAPVMAVVPRPHEDPGVLLYAADYAGRRGLDIKVMGADGPGLSSRVEAASAGTSLVFLPRPARLATSGLPTWPLELMTSSRAQSPVVLVSA